MIRPRFRNLALALLLALAPAVVAEDTQTADDSPSPILGNWLCQDGPCLDEEIQFAIEDGQRVYNSWLHARPSASGGHWSLEGDRLTIECCGGLEISQGVVAVERTSLRLREPESGEVAVYSRVELAGDEIGDE